jgi:hypothetical protein
MKTLSGIAVLVTVAFVICGGTVSSASALCLHLDRLDPKSAEATKQFEDPACTKAATKGLYIEVKELGNELAPRLYCAKVEKGTGVYEDAKCEKAGGNKEFVKVKLGLWLINGTGLASGSTLALAVTAHVDESSVLNVPSLGIELTCTGGSNQVLTGTKPYLQGPDNGGAEALIFEGCSEITPAGCTIETKIETVPVIATVELAASLEDRIIFAPKEGKPFANIEFFGSCALSGLKPVKGQVTIGGPAGQTEQTLQPLAPIGTLENHSLEQGGKPAYLEKGRALLKLASGASWSFQ